jgi:hypothetical protein
VVSSISARQEWPRWCWRGCGCADDVRVDATTRMRVRVPSPML